MNKSFSQFFLEDAAMYQSIAAPSLGFGQKEFGKNPRKSITGGTYDITSIGATECEEETKNDRKRISKRKNTNNRINSRRIQRRR